MDFDEARHLLAAGANPKVSICGFFNWTALHFCCQHGELGFAEELIEVYGINPEAEDKEGRTPLHIACQFGHISIARYLISKCKCDPDYLDFEEQTPLHHAVGWLSECFERRALEIAEFLISFAQCNPHLKDVNGKNALLHACEKGFLTVVQYLINNCGSDATETDSYGNTCLHLAASYANHLRMVEYLMKLIPENTFGQKGNTVLHTACAANSDLDIIKFLLTIGKYDPNFRNEDGKQPLHLTTKKEIKRLLYMHGATPDNVLEKHGALLFDELATSSRRPSLKVLVFGDRSSGKSTLINTVQREGLSSFVFSFSQQRTAICNEQTQGLQIVEFQNKSGSFSFYDFSGREEYRSLHSALLYHILYHSTAAIVLVVNLCESVEELRWQMCTWLSLVNDSYLTIKTPLHVIILGSHSDLLKFNVSQIWKDLNVEQLVSQYSKLELLDCIALDSRRIESSQIAKLRKHLGSSYQLLCSPEPVHFNAQCLYSIFRSRFVGSLAISVEDLYRQVSVSEDSNISASRLEYFIPCSERLLSDLCIYMNHVGLSIYLHRGNSEKGLTVLDRDLFLDIISSVFNRSVHPPIKNSGIVCLSPLLLQKCDINVAVNVLMQLQVCQAIPINCVNEKSESSGETCYDRYLYCPALAMNSAPNSVWAFDPRFKCHFGWTLRFGTKVSIRFIEVLLIRMTDSFFQILGNKEIQFTCWKDGISGLSVHGCEFLSEVNDRSSILIIMRSAISSLKYMKLRSELIRVCYDVTKELCCGIVTEELFIDPFEAVQYPLKPPLYIAYFTFAEVVKAARSANATVLSTTGDRLTIKDLIGHDPYIDLDLQLAHFIFECPHQNSTISDDHLYQLASTLNTSDYLTELFLVEGERDFKTYQVLSEWCKHTKATYQSLRQVLSRASVLANRVSIQ